MTRIGMCIGFTRAGQKYSAQRVKLCDLFYNVMSNRSVYALYEGQIDSENYLGFFSSQREMFAFAETRA
jgi:hypothetical protein